MFRITENKGFQITFSNGLTSSCQMGNSNYCDNKEYERYEHLKEMKQRITSCENCEVAIWDEDDNWITGKIFEELELDTGDGEVVGWVDADTIAKVIGYLITR